MNTHGHIYTYTHTTASIRKHRHLTGILTHLRTFPCMRMWINMQYTCKYLYVIKEAYI